jgi:hypothetical protein
VSLTGLRQLMTNALQAILQRILTKPFAGKVEDIELVYLVHDQQWLALAYCFRSSVCNWISLAAHRETLRSRRGQPDYGRLERVLTWQGMPSLRALCRLSGGSSLEQVATATVEQS